MKIVVFGLALVSLISMGFAMSPVEYATSIGASRPMIDELRDACQTANNPKHCFGVGLSISKAESNMCNIQTSHGCFGMMGASDKSAYRWVKSYNKYRYTATNGHFFYGDWGELGRSRYCVSEHSSGSTRGCPNGKNHFNAVYNDYMKIVDQGLTTLEETGYPKQGCRRVGNVEADEYVQIDTRLGQLRKMIFPKAKSKLFICSQ